MNSGEFQAQTQRLNEVVERASSLSDEKARSTALELLQAAMDMHGTVMSRIVEILSGSGEAGRASLAKLGADPLVCGLLVLYGIHPVALEERVSRALEKQRAQFRKQGGSVTLLQVTDQVVRVKIQSENNGFHFAPENLKSAAEQTILEAAPEVVEIVVEGVISADFVPVNMIQPATKEEKTYEESTA
ncbi:MAG TPA: NifU family protein [Candidatus Sulfotelmatobacter sp.]|nr:NifU family protein [Candidatus Sulfotelmatobacter sp.]